MIKAFARDQMVSIKRSGLMIESWEYIEITYSVYENKTRWKH